MRYITTEQFKEQSKEVQEVFLGWWEPIDGDLSATHIEKEILWGIETITEQDIPLFTLQQLWEFIEGKYKYIEVINFHEIYEVSAYKELSQIKASIEGANKDLLQAFWECACAVAKL